MTQPMPSDQLVPGEVRFTEPVPFTKGKPYLYRCLGCEEEVAGSIIADEGEHEVRPICGICSFELPHNINIEPVGERHLMACKCGIKSWHDDEAAAGQHAEAHREQVSAAHRRLRALR